jgi:hypothetical protein
LSKAKYTGSWITDPLVYPETTLDGSDTEPCFGVLRRKGKERSVGSDKPKKVIVFADAADVASAAVAMMIARNVTLSVMLPSEVETACAAYGHELSTLH